MYFSFRRQLTRSTFAFTVDANDQEYCFINTVLLHKNVKASLSAKEFSDLKQARMYENSGVERCPVKSLKFYLNHLPSQTKEDTLFPLVTKTGKISQSALIGKNTLGDLMKKLSNTLTLSKMYYNHCLRVTGINVMHESGMSHEAIATITGHKSTASVQRYIRTSDNQLKTASRCLSDAACFTNKNASLAESASDNIGKWKRIDKM